MSGIVGQNLGRASGLIKSGGVGADAVDSANIADDAIDSEHYTNASIDNAHLADNAVDTDEIADNAVSLAKMAGGTDGQIITYDASGDPSAVGPGTDGQVLTSTGAGSPPAFEDAAGGGITHADQWRINSDASGDGALTANWEQTDTAEFSVLGSSMTESSGIFTFPSTGYWLVIFQCYWAYTVKSRYMDSFLQVTTNNSNYYNRSHSSMSISPVSSGNTSSTSSQSMIVDVTDTANVKVKVEVDIDNNSTVIESETGYQRTGFQFIRLGDT